MHFNQRLKLEVNKNDVLEAIIKAKSNLFVDNLRDRHPNVQFDSKLRGYIGEICLKKWFLDNNIIIDLFGYTEEGGSIDVDFKYRNLDIELKTSLIPDIDNNLENTFNKRDIKIIKRENKIENLKGDVHIQIYYEHKRKKKDNWLKKQVINLKSNEDDLYQKFLGNRYLNETFLFGWIDKSTLIDRINLLPNNKKTWSYKKRQFWVCPLSNSKPPQELIKHLKNY
jgi:hypothetical protein